MGTRAQGTGIALALALAGSVVPSVARAGDTGVENEPLSAAELIRLGRGGTVTREQTIVRAEHRYVGGVTYTLVEASPAELDALMEDTAAYRRVLPRTKDARLVGQNDGDTFIELHQGNSLVEAAYTIRIHKDRDGARFWLDPSKPHAIADAWGFFRYRPYDGTRVLLTYGILVDIGPGIVRDLFEERVRVAMLSVPQLLRRYVSSTPLASR